MANHDGIAEMTEQEAAALFETAEVADTGERVRAYFRDADTIAARVDELHRQTHARRAEIHAKRQQAAAKTQAEGMRLLHIQANEEDAAVRDLEIEAALEENRSERETLTGERAWAELAAKLGAYISHPHRLEVRAREHPGKVYCYDAAEGEMGLHSENACPQSALRHDHGQREGADTVMLRRRNAKGKLALWPGRREV